MSTRDIIASAAGGSGAKNWISTISQAGKDPYNSDIAMDSDGNIYTVGATDAGGFLVKIDSTGAIVWQKLFNSGTGLNYSRIVLDSSGNIFTCGTTSVGGASLVVVKHNSSGTPVWNTTITASNGVYGSGVAVAASGNVYVCGTTYPGTWSAMYMAKLNSSGSVQWQKFYGPSVGYSTFFNDIAVDASENVYLAGAMYSSGNAAPMMMCVDSSGNLSWYKSLSGGGSGYVGYASSVAVDSSGNIAFALDTSDGAGLVRLSPSASTLQTYFCYNNNGYSNDGAKVYCDSLGNTYFATTLQSASPPNLLAEIKFNSSYSVEWIRSISLLNSTTDSPQTAGLTANIKNYIFSFYWYRTGSNRKIAVTNFPATGAKTGTYGDYVYSSYSVNNSFPSVINKYPGEPSHSTSISSISLTSTNPGFTYQITSV